MISGLIENEMEQFYLELERLFQAEVDRFLSSIQIIRDYYHSLDSRALLEVPITTIDIIKDDPSNVNNIPLEDDQNPNLFPRIESLYKTALKVQFQYDEAINSAEKAKLAAQLDKEAKDKKAAKVVKTGKNVNPNEAIQLEESKVTYEFDEELIKAVKLTKQKFRFKVTLLKYWGISYMQNYRSQAASIYDKLEDWIILSYKAENQALDKLVAQ